jgi:CHAD domain-containing protein
VVCGVPAIEVSEPQAGRVAVGYLERQVTRLKVEEARVRAEAEDSVHQMRVATRRMRSVLATSRPLFEPLAVETLRRELGWLAAVLGGARDAEVIRAALQEELAKLPAELVVGPVAERINLELWAIESAALGQVTSVLDGERYASLLGSLEQFLAEPPFSSRATLPARGQLRARVSKACRRLEREVAALPGLDQPDARDYHLHEVRKAAKRARYAAEAALEIGGGRARALAAAMAGLQSLLGDHQDTVVQRQWLRDLQLRALQAGESGFTFDLLYQRAARRAGLVAAGFEEAWTAARTAVTVWPG